MTQTPPGELFIKRNAGNIVPPYGAISGGEAATIEFAVGGLGVKDIVICRHLHCGAMNGLLAPEKLSDLPMVGSWPSYADSTQRIMQENYQHITDGNARLTATVEENVLVQFENLRTHPSVAAALARNQINLHAWVYKFETGQALPIRRTENSSFPSKACWLPRRTKKYEYDIRNVSCDSLAVSAAKQARGQSQASNEQWRCRFGDRCRRELN